MHMHTHMPPQKTGSYIGSGATEKVLPVSRHILATMAGGAADCAFWIRHLAMQVGVWRWGLRQAADAAEWWVNGGAMD